MCAWRREVREGEEEREKGSGGEREYGSTQGMAKNLD